MNVENSIKSPCISLCTLNEDDICVGCYRTVVEITQWMKMDNSKRLEVLERCRERSKVNNPFA